MARKKEQIIGDIPELNLGPIMNMVVILIPLLLLSVVFTEVGVINITAPKLAMGPSTEAPKEEDKPPLKLTVSVEDRGLRISALGAPIPTAPGCPADGPTVCLTDPSANMTALIETAVKNLKGADNLKKEGAKQIRDLTNLYNWKELYNQLMKIKESYPDETVINISASPTIPYALIVRLMDVARYKLEAASYSNDSEFWSAKFQTTGSEFAPLFPDPVLNLAQ